MPDRCICCGRDIPEGRQVCMQCETMPVRSKPDGYLKDGTPLYLKLGNKARRNGVQMRIYELLTRRK